MCVSPFFVHEAFFEKETLHLNLEICSLERIEVENLRQPKARLWQRLLKQRRLVKLEC